MCSHAWWDIGATKRSFGSFLHSQQSTYVLQAAADRRADSARFDMSRLAEFSEKTLVSIAAHLQVTSCHACTHIVAAQRH